MSNTVGGRFVLQVYVGAFSRLYEALSIEASRQTTAEEIVECISEKLSLKEFNTYELAEVVGTEGSDLYRERRLAPTECPVLLQLQWPPDPTNVNTSTTTSSSSHISNGPRRTSNGTTASTTTASSSSITVAGSSTNEPEYRFCLRKKHMQCMNWSFSWTDSNDSQLLKDYFLRFLYQPKDKEYPDLCQLPDLTEQTLLENLKARFEKGHIYTYVGSILIAVNPFRFFPIYNPKYVQLYQNRAQNAAPPHVFAVADAAYQAMLRKRYNQCIVISGESGSGKTESTNLLLHHLTALSQKGTHGSGVEQTILGTGPVLEAFGNAKTKHNNNSSRFGKFIQVNYKENGMVHGAVVQKYLLEKSRIVSQAKNERNYHVFYYLLAGASAPEKEALYLTKPADYTYLNQSRCYTLDGVDEAYEYNRLKQSLEMVGFTPEKHRRLNSVLSAVLHLGNVEFVKKSTYHCDEAVMVKNPDEVSIISKLLMVKEETLLSALTCKRTKAAKGEMIIMNYRSADAIATRDAMAKCLYGALFDWIVLQVNQALLIKKDTRDHRGNYIGVLDIFGFEDFGDQNYFEQFCINFANEHLHYYFNQHVFKYEQEEYQREGINWKSIDFHDNLACLQLVEGRPQGLLCLLDDQCNFPGANNQTVLQKFVNHHKNSPLFEVPPCRQSAFVIKHYAGKVKYQIKDFREKNLDLMRPDIVCLLKSSSSAFVRELVGQDPLAIFRWQILKAFFRAYFIFTRLRQQSKERREKLADSGTTAAHSSGTTTAVSKKLGGSSDKSPASGDYKITIKRSSRSAIASNSAFQRFNNSIMNSNNEPNPPKLSRPSVISLKSTFPQTPCSLHGVQNCQCQRNDSDLLHKANQIIQKSKLNRPPSFKSRGIEKSIKNLQTLKAIVGKNTQPLGRSGTKRTPTVTFQFQQSLNHLMDTLNQANPFFVRCIKSNTQKTPNNFDDMLVLVQLRYTGMLETVRIRQSGYSVRLTFEEFIQHYRILLPRGLLSSRQDINDFLERMQLNRDNYQMGKSKVFLRESEKLCLDDILHQEILRRIITLQRWVRTWITQRKFYQMREAVLVIQKHVRRWLAQQRFIQLRWINNYEQWAAVTIQKAWKSFKDRSTFVRFREATINFQANVRGFLSRRKFRERLASFGRSRSPSQPSFVVSTSSPMVCTVKRLSLVTDSLDNSGDIRRSNGRLEREEPKAKRQELPFDPKYSDQVSTESKTTKDSHESIGSTQEDSDLEPSLSVRSRIRSLAEISNTYRHSVLSRERSSLNRMPDTSSSLRHSTLLSDSLSSSRKSSTADTFTTTSTLYSLDRTPTTSETTINTTPPPLPPRKQSQPTCEPITTVSGFRSTASEGESVDVVDDDDYDYGDQEQEPRLDRRRNRPLRKLSLKRSKSSKFQTSEDNSNLLERVTRSPSETDIIRTSSIAQQPPQPCSAPVLRSSSPTKLLESTLNTFVNTTSTQASDVGGQPQQKNAFQKAKKHFKTLIIGGSSKSDRKSKENLVDLDSTTDDSVMSFNVVDKSQASIMKRPKSNSCSVDLGSFATVVGHQLVNCYEPIKSELCSVCENQISKHGAISRNVLKCVDCALFFHADCSPSSVQIPCVSKKSVDFYTNASFAAFAEPSRPPRLKQRFKHHPHPPEVQYGGGGGGGVGGRSESLDTQRLELSRSSLDTRASSESNKRKTSNEMPVVKSKSSTKLSKSSKSYQYGSSSSWSVTRTTEFTDPRDILITDVTELHYMEIFIGNKLCEMESTKKTKKAATKESMVDVVFKNALKEFKSNLISTYSVASADGRLHITYKSLIEHFEQVVLNVCQKENTWKTFPVIMGVNAFRGYLDEFRNLSNKLSTSNDDHHHRKSDKPQKGVKRKRGKKKEPREDLTERCGHQFHSVTANIPTVCEVCQSLMWLMEKVWVCKQCKLTCHKKCILKITSTCRSVHSKQIDKRVFGAPLESLVGDEQPIPAVLEKLITAIELRGLYTEGLYRKSGTASKITELKGKLDESLEPLDLDSYSVHVLSAALKSFFREMPEPLMTFELYDDFLWSTTISDPQEKVQAIFSHIQKLPRANFDVLERLLFHLARVAQQEEANRMNANSLAIVFAPCVLRTDKPMQMQDKLSDIGKQTVVLECVINERLKQVRDTLADIDILDTACQTASSRLSSLRLSKLHLNRDHAVQAKEAHEDEEVILAQQIKHLRTEKAILTNMLPSFRLTGSDEDLLSNPDYDQSVPRYLDDLLPSPSKFLSFKLDTPLLPSELPDTEQGNLRHLTKNRVAAPSKRRLPSKFNNKPRSSDPLSTVDDEFSVKSIHPTTSGLHGPYANGSNEQVNRDLIKLNERSVRV